MTPTTILVILAVLVAAFIAFKIFVASVKMTMRLLAVGAFVIALIFGSQFISL